MNKEEAESLLGNLSLLRSSVQDAEESARKKIEAVQEDLRVAKSKLNKQVSSTVEALSDYVKDRFLANYSKCLLVHNGLSRVVEVVSSNPEDPNAPHTGSYDICARMAVTHGICPGHQFFSERSEDVEQVATFTTTLDGTVHKITWRDVDQPLHHFSVIDDPDGTLHSTGVVPEYYDDSSCPVRESVDQLKKRIARFTEQTEKEENPAYAKVYQAVLKKMGKKLETMIANGDSVWWA